MGSCAAQTFTNITVENWEAIKAKAEQNNINIEGDSGESTQQGFTFSWQFDASLATLTIQCLDHPFLIPCGTVNAKVHDLVDSA